MAGVRDPLSERYHWSARRAVMRAITAHYAGQSASAWIASPGPEFRNLDRGGRTAHERAFTRAAYWWVWREPINNKRTPTWSLKLTWGPIERRGDRYGRTVQLRMFTRGGGVRHNARNLGKSWASNEALRSTPGARY